MKKVYIVTSRFTKREDWTAITIDSRAFYSRYEATLYCQSKLNEEELAHQLKMQKRNLRNWYEFYSKDYVYEIEECEVD